MQEQAREFAIAAHGDQRYGAHPYSVHLDMVASIAKPFGGVAEVIAYLHDVVEDTEVAVDDIEAQFGALVSQAVEILTDESGSNRKERKAKTYAKMAKVVGETEIALVVKVADRLANMRACVADKNERLLTVYKTEYPVFKKSVYRAGACDELWTELEGIFAAQG